MGALRGPGKAAPADGLDRAGVRARLDSSAEAAEQHQLLLRAHGSVALREARHGRSAVAARRPEALRRQHDRLQRPRGTHGLAAVGAAVADQPAAGGARCAGSGHGAQGLRGEIAQGRHARHELRGPGSPEQLAAQSVRLALEPAGVERQGPRIFPQASARHQQWRAGQGPRQGGSETDGGRLARRGARRQARPPRDARLPHEHHVPLFGHRVADRHVVREERPQHQRHAPVHPSAVDRRGSCMAEPQRLGHLQGLRQEIQRSVRRPPGCREGSRADAADARQPGRIGPAVRGARLEARRMRARSRQDRAADNGGRARLSQCLPAFHRAGTADGQGRQRRQGHWLEYADRGEAAGRAQRHRARRGRHLRHGQDRIRYRRLRSGHDAGAGNQRPCCREGMGGTVQDHGPRAQAPGAVPRGREDPFPRHPGAAAQDHQLADVERHRERDGQLQRRLYERARAHSLAHADRTAAVLSGPPVDDRVRRGLLDLPAARRPQEPPRRSTTSEATATPRSCSTSSRHTRSGGFTAPTPTT